MDTTTFSGWAIVELMGHRQRAGEVAEVELCGSKLLRIDMPTPDGAAVTEFYGGGAIFSIRPCSEDVARRTAVYLGDPRPIAPTTYREQLMLERGTPDQDGGDDPYDDEGLTF